MAKHDEIPTTDPAEIEALIERIKQGQLEPRDTQLLERLLRLALSLVGLLQQKNASMRFIGSRRKRKGWIRSNGCGIIRRRSGPVMQELREWIEAPL